jgi:tungstate transport system substrate-binding protein
MELQLWTAARLDPRAALGSRYLILGRGMGRTLEIAAALEAYTLTDRATWASFKDRQRLELLVEADPALFHPYASILVNPNKGSHTNAMEARIWHEWLTSDRGRVAIASYRLRGEQLFYPTGTRPGI